MARFPTISVLARARQASVVKAWRGLGYYRRARQLHRAAQIICRDHSGRIPCAIADLRTLPGIGPYSAGAIASIGFGVRTPIVDGNIARVLMRVHGQHVDCDSKSGREWLWDRAREYVDASRFPAAANEGLMELGATMCTPAHPACADCPIRRGCTARRQSAQDRIPQPRKRAVRTALHAQVVVPRVRGLGAVVQRGSDGLWAGLLFPPMIESKRPISRATVAQKYCVTVKELLGGRRFTVLTTHRAVHFRVWSLSESTADRLKKAHENGWLWKSDAAIERASVASAMSKILAVDREQSMALQQHRGVRSQE